MLAPVLFHSICSFLFFYLAAMHFMPQLLLPGVVNVFDPSLVPELFYLRQRRQINENKILIRENAARKPKDDFVHSPLPGLLALCFADLSVQCLMQELLMPYDVHVFVLCLMLESLMPYHVHVTVHCLMTELLMTCHVTVHCSMPELLMLHPCLFTLYSYFWIIDALPCSRLWTMSQPKMLLFMSFYYALWHSYWL